MYYYVCGVVQMIPGGVDLVTPPWNHFSMSSIHKFACFDSEWQLVCVYTFTQFIDIIHDSDQECIIMCVIVEMIPGGVDLVTPPWNHLSMSIIHKFACFDSEHDYDQYCITMCVVPPGIISPEVLFISLLA
jgi:hypothetical protein